MRDGRRWRVGALALLAALVLASALWAVPAARAQDPTLFGASSGKSKGTFQQQKGQIFSTPQKVDRAAPLYLQGDELLYDTRGQKVTARGNVEIYYNSNILLAEEVVYDQGKGTLEARNGQLKQPGGEVIQFSFITLTDDFRDAFVDSLAVVGKDETRIAARRAVRRDGFVTEYDQGKFTPCKNEPGKPPLWCVSARRIVHDQKDATITYQDAQFEFFGVPVLYLPYFSHADPSVKRRSGFLIPEIGNSSTLGFTMETPYYFALSPHYDFLFHPLYTSKQGILWQGDWRQRMASGQFYVKFAFVDQNDTNESTAGGVLDQRWRGSVQTKGVFSLASWWRFGWDITIESDDSFRRFYKLDSILQTDRVNTLFLTGQSDRNYFNLTFYHFGGLLIEDTAQAESRVHPMVDWNYIFKRPIFGGELGFDVNILSLSRDPSDDKKILGTDTSRMIVDLHWRRRMIDPLGQVFTPFWSLRGDLYKVSSFQDPDTLAAIESENVSRFLPTIGLTYQYPWVWNTASAAHIVEPIAQVVVRPDTVAQRRLPDEDAKSLVFDDTNLFDRDKFSGYDRLETGTRVNYGLQYTFQPYKTGFVRALVGQSWHLSGRNQFTNPGLDATGANTFNPASGLETDRSDYVLGLYVAPFDGFRLIGQARYDEHTLALRHADALAHLAFGPLSATAIYSFQATDPLIGILSDQQDITGATTLRLAERWWLSATARYDIDARELLQDSIALKYADECFVLTLTYTETFIRNEKLDLKPDSSIMLRFELKHVGQFAYKTDALDHVFGENQTAK